MKPNVNSVTLISKKNIARVANFLFKVKLQALFYCLQLWQKETFSTHFFLGIIRVAVPLIIYFKKALKDYTVKASLSKTGKAFRYQAFAYALQSECFEKNENTQGKH